MGHGHNATSSITKGTAAGTTVTVMSSVGGLICLGG